MKIPHDREGYSVNPTTSSVHTRYAGAHAGETQRTRTLAGAEALLGGKSPRLCRTCYPSSLARVAPGADQPQSGQARRASNGSQTRAPEKTPTP